MKKLLALALFSLLCLSSYGQTGRVYSVNTVSNMFYTNSVMWTNILNGASSNQTYLSSNMFWRFTNQFTLTTNFAVIVPNSQTNWLKITNSILTGITNQAP
jgi:hypothetical protein